MNSKLIAKGYNPYRDTVAINPYEYLIIHKGYTPIFRECDHESELNAKLSIKGFEDADYIPFNRLRDTFSVMISDTSIKEITQGQLIFSFRGGGFTHYLKINDIKQLNIIYPSKFIDQRSKRMHPETVIFFFGINVLKNGVIYQLPSRKYWVR